MAPYGKALAPFYFAMTTTMRLGLLLLSRWHVEGKEGVPPGGPLIVVSNHISGIDPPLLAASIPRKISFLAKRELFDHPIFGRMIKMYGSVPIARAQASSGAQKEAMDVALELLNAGRVLGIFPEGTRSRGNGLQAGKPGVALLALRSNAPILPVAITGSERVRGPGVLFSRPRIRVRIGEPFTLPGMEGNIGRAQFVSGTDMIMRRVAALLPAQQRGVYATEKRQRAAVVPES